MTKHGPVPDLYSTHGCNADTSPSHGNDKTSQNCFEYCRKLQSDVSNIGRHHYRYLQWILDIKICNAKYHWIAVACKKLSKDKKEIHHSFAIGTTRPIPPYRRLCLGCIRWKDMSNPKRLRWLTKTYESPSVITNQSEHLEQRAIGKTRPLPPNRGSCNV